MASMNRSDIAQYPQKHSVIPYIYTAISMMKQLGHFKQPTIQYVYYALIFTVCSLNQQLMSGFEQYYCLLQILFLSHTKKVFLYHYYTDCACTYVTPYMLSAVTSSTIHELLVTQKQSISSRVGTGTDFIYRVLIVRAHMSISYI